MPPSIAAVRQDEYDVAPLVRMRDDAREGVLPVPDRHLERVRADDRQRTNGDRRDDTGCSSDSHATIMPYLKRARQLEIVQPQRSVTPKPVSGP